MRAFGRPGGDAPPLSASRPRRRASGAARTGVEFQRPWPEVPAFAGMTRVKEGHHGPFALTLSLSKGEGGMRTGTAPHGFGGGAKLARVTRAMRVSLSCTPACTGIGAPAASVAIDMRKSSWLPNFGCA